MNTGFFVLVVLLLAGVANAATLQWSSPVEVSQIHLDKGGYSVLTKTDVGLGCQSGGKTLRFGFHDGFPSESESFSESEINGIASLLMFAMASNKAVEFRINTDGELCFIHELKVTN